MQDKQDWCHVNLPFVARPLFEVSTSWFVMRLATQRKAYKEHEKSMNKACRDKMESSTVSPGKAAAVYVARH